MTQAGIEPPSMYFSRYHKGVRYLFLDSNYAHLPSGEESEVQRWNQSGEYSGVGFSAAQVNWLRDELARDRETLTFVITHHPIASKSEYPIISPRDLGAPNKRIGPVWRKLFPTYHTEVLDILESASNVKVVFTGHWHINDITRVNNLYHVKTSSLIEYPFEYRVVSVFEKFLDISIAQLPAEDLLAASLVLEWQNEWIRGESFDRERRIYFDDESVATRF
jgi:3',5'-cyclic AMP phosphodiesterase CpdA